MINIKKLLKKENKGTHAAKRHSCILLSENSPFNLLESFKTLRTNILFSTGSTAGSKVIPIVSSVPSEGKSTTAINLAITFAETENRILLLDADLRKPKIKKYLNINSKSGLSEYLGGFSNSDEIIAKTSYGFDCITAGRVPPNPADLLSSERMALLIDTLKQKYDFIFIDCAPVNVVTDALLVSAHADGVLYVVNPSVALNSQVEDGISKLKFGDIKTLGFIMNGVSTDKKSNRYKSYRYKNYYSYEYKPYIETENDK